MAIEQLCVCVSVDLFCVVLQVTAKLEAAAREYNQL